MAEKRKRDAHKAAIVQRVAEICNVSTRQVYRVIEGNQNNESILRAYMELDEGSNQLLKKVKELIPFD